MSLTSGEPTETHHAAGSSRRRSQAVRRFDVNSVLREPLVHFIVLGLLLFGGYSLLERDRGAEVSPTQIALTVDDLAQLLLVFESKWRRQPTQDEFNAMVEDRMREEVLYREALTLGLDKDDTIVKRRMAQKMQFLAEDLATAREPTTAELRSWFAQNIDLFAMPSRLSFHHLYFSPDKRGDRARDEAEQALARLSGQPDNTDLAAALADPFMFQDNYGDKSPQAVAREFGPEFAVAISRLNSGSWQGPVKSGFGWHLVFVDSVVAGRAPAFEEVEQEVKTAWLGQQKADAWKRAYDAIRSKYTFLLPVPSDDAVAAISVTAGQPDAPQREEGD